MDSNNIVLGRNISWLPLTGDPLGKKVKEPSSTVLKAQTPTSEGSQSNELRWFDVRTLPTLISPIQLKPLEVGMILDMNSFLAGNM